MATIRGNLALPNPDSGATNADGNNIIATPVVIIGSDGNYASLSGGSGGGGGDASAANQTAVQAMAGTASTKVIGVQGASGGIPITTTDSGTPVSGVSSGGSGLTGWLSAIFNRLNQVFNSARSAINVYLLNQDPFAAYDIQDVDESGLTTKYYGFMNTAGGWFILSITSGTTYRKATGSSGYVAAWANRAVASGTTGALTYNYTNLITIY